MLHPSDCEALFAKYAHPVSVWALARVWLKMWLKLAQQECVICYGLEYA